MAGNDYYVEAGELSPDPKADIKAPLEKTISGILDVPGKDVYAWDTILILLFNHIDLLGTLLSGDSSRANRAKRAVGFIRTYLGRITNYDAAKSFVQTLYELRTDHPRKEETEKPDRIAITV